MNIEEIGRLAQIMSDHELTEVLVESEEVKLKLKRGPRLVAAAMHHPLPAQAAPAPASAAPAAPAPAADAPKEDICVITSPIVGTFYASPAPDAAPFIKAGDKVSADSVVCIIEAMKVMNEIKAEQSGTIKRILVENATPVEFGQPLFEVTPL